MLGIGAKDERRSAGMIHLRKRLVGYYARLRLELEDDKVYEIFELTEKMIRHESTLKLKAKAAETRTILGFAVELLREMLPRMHTESLDFLVRAGLALEEYYSMIKLKQKKLAAVDRIRLVDCCLTHIRCFQEFGGKLYPKFHLFLHLTLDIAFLGNPKYYHTFADEAFNGRIAAIARQTHSRTFAINVFRRLLYGEQTTSA
jgi:hypothetical protein